MIRFWLKTPLYEEAPHLPGGAPLATSTQIFTKEQVEDLITRTRREEKDKLYDDIRRSRDENAELKRRLEALEGKAPTAQTADEAAALKTKIADMEKQIADNAAKADAAVTAALNTANADFQKTLSTELTKQRLDTLRSTLIDSAKGEVIPELITGSTDEEVRASFEKSKARFQELVTPRVEEVKKTLGAGALPTPVTPGGGANSPIGAEINANGMRGISDKEWPAKREEIKKKAFDQAGLPMKVR